MAVLALGTSGEKSDTDLFGVFVVAVRLRMLLRFHVHRLLRRRGAAPLFHQLRRAGYRRPIATAYRDASDGHP